MTWMFYNQTLDRWMVEGVRSAHELHCGQSFDLVIGERYVPTRLELDRNWYVIMEGVRFYLRTKDTYQIILF